MFKPFSKNTHFFHSYGLYIRCMCEHSVINVLLDDSVKQLFMSLFAIYVSYFWIHMYFLLMTNKRNMLKFFFF